ncbi:glutathione S-transferase domain-containing protein [Sarocladium implicatum]|nr:glutathione S-transferase domain-containing protein [Sarocladium implicatum]
MPAFTLYASPNSTYSKRVRLTLAEAGFDDYELVLLNLMKGEQKQPSHIQRHPFGKVPVVVFPDGFTLYESRAICKYLCKRFSFPLLPAESDLEASTKFDHAQMVEMTYFADFAGSIAFEKYAKKLRGIPTDDAVVQEALKSLEAFFDVAEGFLSQQDWMAGDEFTLVDIFYIPLVERLVQVGHGDLVTSRKAVNAWWERATSRPAIAKLLAADKAEAAARGMPIGI